MDLNCTIRTDAQTWLTVDNGQPAAPSNKGGFAHVLVSVFLHGIITKPLGS